MATEGTTARGLYLRLLRDAHRWNQKDVAAAIGVTLNTISRAELGVHEPGKHLPRLLHALGGSLEDWVNLEDGSLDDALQMANRRIDLLRKTTPDQLRNMIERRRRREN